MHFGGVVSKKIINKRHMYKINILFVLSLFLCGCDFSTDVKNHVSTPRGNYSIKIFDQYEINTYANGGALFLIARGILIDENENVDLQIICDSKLKVVIFPEKLTFSNWFSELYIKPDITIDLGSYPVTLLCTYSGKKDTFNLKINIKYKYENVMPNPPEKPAGYIINLLQENNFCRNLNGNETWNSSYLSVTGFKIGSPFLDGTRFLSGEYEIVYISYSVDPVYEIWIAYRRRYVDLNYTFVLRSWNREAFRIMDIENDLYVRFSYYFGFKKR
jgi:hypothetical protein